MTVSTSMSDIDVTAATAAAVVVAVSVVAFGHFFGVALAVMLTKKLIRVCHRPAVSATTIN